MKGGFLMHLQFSPILRMIQCMVGFWRSSRPLPCFGPHAASLMHTGIRLSEMSKCKVLLSKLKSLMKRCWIGGMVCVCVRVAHWLPAADLKQRNTHFTTGESAALGRFRWKRCPHLRNTNEDIVNITFPSFCSPYLLWSCLQAWTQICVSSEDFN